MDIQIYGNIYQNWNYKWEYHRINHILINDDNFIFIFIQTIEIFNYCNFKQCHLKYVIILTILYTLLYSFYNTHAHHRRLSYAHTMIIKMLWMSLKMICVVTLYNIIDFIMAILLFIAVLYQGQGLFLPSGEKNYV